MILRTSAYSYNALSVNSVNVKKRLLLIFAHFTQNSVTDASHNGSTLVVCTRSRKNQETQEGILEWLQQLELAYVELMGRRKDPELHAKMLCEGMVQMQSELIVCVVNERRKSLVQVY